MRPSNDALAQEILEQAKKDFLHNGYRKTSVRGIAAAVDVTTGALYRYYASKEALFDAIVEEPAQELLDLFETYAENNVPCDEDGAVLSDLPYRTTDHMKKLVAYIYEHYDVFKLIASCAEGTKYAHYVERLIAIETVSAIDLIEELVNARKLTHSIDDMFIHMIITSMFTGIFEIIAHDEPIDDAVAHIESLQRFYAAGWSEMLRES